MKYTKQERRGYASSGVIEGVDVSVKHVTSNETHKISTRAMNWSETEVSSSDNRCEAEVWNLSYIENDYHS